MYSKVPTILLISSASCRARPRSPNLTNGISVAPASTAELKKQLLGFTSRC
eukprot:CAMPEP_0115462314 /NCGR_PEP_ID=MMETSP0271-20121206/47756_1 /TAXON_ID=71861 /ORGANISM="Scrippsiella trochoidea, Strain CCMP3099" /LENGTH=50 /DNA_ID=CAMNT_0002889089 /DNA_START=89 /DNA_END=238 /DNA_ORIENTATION=-